MSPPPPHSQSSSIPDGGHTNPKQAGSTRRAPENEKKKQAKKSQTQTKRHTRDTTSSAACGSQHGPLLLQLSTYPYSYCIRTRYHIPPLSPPPRLSPSSVFCSDRPISSIQNLRPLASTLYYSYRKDDPALNPSDLYPKMRVQF